ncbi:hypothetical protein D1007_22466 [Hordeum vulgare]|nr:hypothetical protein D1007_22466 [Hordeum vulgare]
MKTACLILIVVWLAVAALGREQPADALLHQREAEGGWRRAADNETKLVIIRGRQGRELRKGAPAKCVPAATCRRRMVVCGKRCYTARSRLALVPPATKCVMVCKKCVPTC